MGIKITIFNINGPPRIIRMREHDFAWMKDLIEAMNKAPVALRCVASDYLRIEEENRGFCYTCNKPLKIEESDQAVKCQRCANK